MLVLSRRVGERIQIGDNIVVTVTTVDGNRVRLGIEAPKHVHIMRKELMLSEVITRDYPLENVPAVLAASA